MENKNGNLVMFPKWKTTLERVGLEALKEKRYKDASEALEPLVEYGVANADVITGLLMSWIELGLFDEAEELCQKQMKEDFEQYYHYLHIYITILFQSNQYEEIINLLEEVFESEEIPHQSRTQLWQMFEVSRKLLVDRHKEEGTKYFDEFKHALDSDDIHKQWQAVDQLKKQSPDPFADDFQGVLMNEKVHPIIKSSILEWFRDGGWTEKLTIKKFGQTSTVVPSELTQLHSDYIIKQIQMRLGQIEQNNPTMYEMINRLLYHYCYVRYPIFPDEKEVPILVEALKQLGHEYLQLPMSTNEEVEDVEKYKSEIELCEQHYVLIVGE
ncbi:tetratricopeptide repeat protein [Halobacillus litoralis]|uniref:Tetratricopeptide repeat protein n=1 Tax=Halobacillus litoralis TaxID=45668 RepID=A0A845E7S8_9BACI|nr:tetratricopeptide repeat protein [Halobacillus litoralis]MYL50229.1 tetratricopeptide repeat protein [Halobacillus litoralis]